MTSSPDPQQVLSRFSFGNPLVERFEGRAKLLLPSIEETKGGSFAEKISRSFRKESRVWLGGVPLHMSIADLHQFLASDFEMISQVQVIAVDSIQGGKRGKRGKREIGMGGEGMTYALLVAFTDVKSAHDFILKFNGKPFSHLEPCKCDAGLILTADINTNISTPKKRKIQPPPSSGPPGKTLTGDAKTGTSGNPGNPGEISGSMGGDVKLETPRDSRRRWRFPEPDYGSAKCPVCLEKITGEDGNPGIRALCLHRFHFECLARWADPSCPVCRASTQPSPPSCCEVCGAVSGLWLCIVCGGITCTSHSTKHFKDTNHPFAARVTAERSSPPEVWDHASRSYITRLLTTDTGKPVEFSNPQSNPSTSLSSNDQELSDVEHATSLKLEQIAIEFNYLLRQQLDTQRRQFERMLDKARGETKREKLHCDKKLKVIKQDITKYTRVLELTEERLLEAQKKKKSLSLELESARTTRERMQSLNSALLKRQEERRKVLESEERVRAKMMRESLDKKETRIKDLQDQIRDLRSFLKTRNSVKCAKREGATVVDVSVTGGRSNDSDKKSTPSSSRRRRRTSRGSKKRHGQDEKKS